MISTPESIPNNFHAILDKYTESGYRVIGKISDKKNLCLRDGTTGMYLAQVLWVL